MNPLSNLPPGVTLKDVDPPTVTCPECEGGRAGFFIPVFVGEKMIAILCPRCGGTGEIRKDECDE